MLRLQDRDIEIIQTLNILKVINSTQMQKLFFNGSQQAQSRRCKQLVNHKHIKCFEPGSWQEYVYYTKRKPTQQLKSMLLITELYVQLKSHNIKISEFQREYCIPNTDIRTDGYFVFERDGYFYDMIVEVDLTHWDGWKYEKYITQGQIFPPLLYISPCKRKYCDQQEKYYIKKDFTNFEDVLCLFE